jgi:hypothetical protein
MKFITVLLVKILLFSNLFGQEKPAIVIKTNNGPIIDKRTTINNFNAKKADSAEVKFCASPTTAFTINPILLSTGLDSFRLEIWICNFGGNKAFNLRDFGTFMYKQEGKYLFPHKYESAAMHPNIELLPGEGKMLYYDMIVSGVNTNTDHSATHIYFYFQIKYTDKLKKKGLFEDILIVDIFNPGKDVFEANDKDYTEMMLEVEAFKKSK